MRRRVIKHLSFANIMSVIAVFLALGGITLAAKHSKKINGSKIKNGSIAKSKLKADVLTGLDTCPSTATNRVGSLCYGPQEAAANWVVASEQTCDAKGLRLPTIGEGLLIMDQAGGANVTWTDEIAQVDPAPQNLRVLVKATDPSGFQVFAAPIGAANPYRCMTDATNPAS